MDKFTDSRGKDQGQRIVADFLEPTTLSSAKRNLVLHFFVELPGILRVCMAPQIIVSGWENTFLSPFDGVKILTHSTSWGVVSEDFATICGPSFLSRQRWRAGKATTCRWLTLRTA